MNEVTTFGGYVIEILVILLAFNALVSILHPLVANFYNIAFKGNLNVSYLADKKYPFYKNSGVAETLSGVLTFDVACGALCIGALVYISDSGHETLIMSTLLVVSGLLILPHAIRKMLDKSSSKTIDKD